MTFNEKAIRALVKTAIESYAEGFEIRHIAEKDDCNGVINMKIHNVFIATLGPEIQYYAALVRSLDSSLGNMLEKLAMNIAQLFYKVSRNVEGLLYKRQIQQIAELLELYKSRKDCPKISDYEILRKKDSLIELKEVINKRHDSDYYLIDEKTQEHYLIELKIGGDLDNKKARSEKEAILEQYAILSNNIESERKIKIYFATAYNRFGEDKQWKQERVRQFFADEELLIGKEFWNFICKSEDGYEIVLSEYKAHAEIILRSLNKIKKTYLG